MKNIFLTILIFCFSLFSLAQNYTIPVVVHVMHTNGETEGSLYNPTDEQIVNSINILNEIYSGSYEGGQLGVGDTNIRFQLARRDENGNCTIGITRHNISSNSNYVTKGVRYNTEDDDCGIDDTELKNLDNSRWNPLKYLNIWIVNKINNSGSNGCPINGAFVSSFPQYDINKDGVVILGSFFTLINQPLHIKTTLAHEIGHYLDLYHVFEEGNTINCPNIITNSPTLCGLLGDKICDTAPVTQFSGTPRTGEPNPCLFNLSLYNDYTERNVMSYSTEPVLFTPDQKARMLTALQNISYRNSLISNNDALNSPISDLIITEQINNNSQITQSLNPTLISISFRENNIGSSISISNYVSFHLSSDSVLTPGNNSDLFLSDVFINQNLNSGEITNLITHQLTIPPSLPTGEYFIFLSADASGLVSECDELNNFATVKLYIVNETSIGLYKYWFDNDFAIAQNGFGGFAQDNNIQFLSNVDQLSTGVHQFNIMFREVGAGWSSISSSLFYKVPVKILGSSKYQYWFDDDFANDITQNIPVSDNYEFSPFVELSQLNNGIHVLQFRFLTTNDTWSVVNSSMFYKMQASLLGINEYQYWFDNDIDNAITLSVAETLDYNLISDITIPNSLTIGNHLFNIRFKQDNNIWSVVQTDIFNFQGTLGNIENEYSKNGILIYPNPTKGELILKSESLEPLDIVIYSIEGKLIQSYNNFTGNKINIESLSNANYIIKINNESFKVIKR